jgi:poly-gamma-glutamate synthesis protein (capsule biosynthesis protein)
MPAAPAVVHSEPAAEDLTVLRDCVGALRDQVDVVVVYFHWGITGMDTEAEYQRVLGRAAIDAGADLVAGSHPHIPQGIELYQRGAILYSLGNFMFGWKLHTHMTRDGLLARVRVRPDAPWRLSFVPVARSEQGQIVAHGPDSDLGRRIADRVGELSAPFGTLIEPDGGEFSVRQADGQQLLGVRGAGQ